MEVYLDNAATTPLEPRVLEVMMPYFTEVHGNPSSIHMHGRKAKTAVETARRKVAELFNTSPSEIFFTSGGTEADNTALTSTIYSKGIKHVISSPIEHHAVLHPLEHLQKQGIIDFHLVELTPEGDIDLTSLKSLLQQYPNSLVSFMHGNNEIGNLADLQAIGTLCKEYDALFHSDTVQTVGHFPIDLQNTPVDFITGSAHKFHGPKGVGFLYINADTKIDPFIHGGAQERNMRGGTENVAGIVGMAKALELAYDELEPQKAHILELKQYLIDKLKAVVPGIAFNGRSAEADRSLYTVLSASFPKSDLNDMLLFSLDIQKISVSGGSACSSGTNIGSHVLEGIKANPDRAAVRFSFSKYNTKEELDFVVEEIKKILG